MSSGAASLPFSWAGNGAPGWVGSGGQSSLHLQWGVGAVRGENPWALRVPVCLLGEWRAGGLRRSEQPARE